MKNEEALEDQIEQKELAPGVILYKDHKKYTDSNNAIGIFIWKVNMKIKKNFQVEITTMSILDFEIILEQSENVEFAGKSIKNDFKTRIEPFQKVEVAKFILKNNCQSD